MTAAERAAGWALALRLKDVPKDVVDAACLHLLDGFGCALAAVRTDAARPAADVARAFGSADEASIIGTDLRAPAPAAALANGTLVHALDYDDTHARALVHATAAVLPTAFAIGEQASASGEEVLASAIAGYEVVIRLGAAVTHGFHAKGFHATSVCGVFSAAVIASRLMGLDQAQTVNALGIAGSLASGSLEFLNSGSSTKQLHPGFAGMNGIIAARLAAAGADGPSSIFEGEYGLFRSFTGSSVDANGLFQDLGSKWEVTRITIKPYPACQLSHASLDALRTLLPKLGDPSTIEQIVFDVPEEIVPIVCEPAAEKARPRTPYEAKFSLPFCAASLIVDGALEVGAFKRTLLHRPQVLDLSKVVSHHVRSFDGAPADAPGSVEVRLASGDVLTASVPSSRGGPSAPMSQEEIVAKFIANGGSEAQARALLSLADQPSVKGVLR